MLLNRLYCFLATCNIIHNNRISKCAETFEFNLIIFHFYYPFILDKFGFMDYNNCDVWAVEVTHIIYVCYQSVDFRGSTD